jgi:SAM-dependent methyltransferase
VSEGTINGRPAFCKERGGAAFATILPSVTLPDASRLSSLRPLELMALGERLREVGLTRERAAEVAAVGAALPDAMRLPLQQWHLRRSRDEAAFATRMLMFGDPVTRRQAAAVLGPFPVERLIECGFLVERRGRLVSPFCLNIVNDLYVVCDDLTHGGDAVMGAAPTTSDLCQAAHPTRPIERFLDLGCGAGTAALLFAERAATSVGVDVNPRAILLSRLNGALNGIEQVEFREGDLFEPVRDESFDLIASQPPFVARPPALSTSTFLHGGLRGDELPARVLGEISHHLRPGGRAVVLVEWPIVDDRPLEERVRDAIGDADVNLLLLRFPATDLDDHCARYAAAARPGLGPTFEREARCLRSHLERLGVRELRLTLNVIQRRDGGPTWSATLDLPRSATRLVTSARIDKLIATRDLLAGANERILQTTLRAVDGVVGAEHSIGNASEETLRLRPAPESLTPEMELNADAAQLLTLVHRSPDVRAAVAAFAIAKGLDPDGARPKVLEGVKDALLRGLLEPVTDVP